MNITKEKKSTLPYIILILGIVTLIAVACILIDGFDDYKRDIYHYVAVRQEAIAKNRSFVSEHPVFIHNESFVSLLYISLAISFFGILYLCFNKSAKTFKQYRLSLCIYIITLLISVGTAIAHWSIGTSENMQNIVQVPNKTDETSASSVGSINAEDEEGSTSVHNQEIETANKCPIASNFGIGRIHWFFNTNKNYYIAFQFISESEAQIGLPNGDIIARPFKYHNAERNDSYIFRTEEEYRGGFTLSEGGAFLRYRIDPSDKYVEHARYVGAAQASTNPNINIDQSGYSAPDNGRPSTTSPSQKDCSLCGGKGWIVGHKTPVYEMGEMYCSECGGYFPNSHSHDPCPSCYYQR